MAADSKTTGDNFSLINNEVSNLKSNLTASDNFQFQFAVDSQGNYGYYTADGSIASFKKNYPEKIFSIATGSYTSITVTVAQYGEYDSLIFIPIYWSSNSVDSTTCTVNGGTNCTYRLVSEAVKSTMVVRCFEIIPIDRTKDLTFTCTKTGDGYTLLGLR